MRFQLRWQCAAWVMVLVLGQGLVERASAEDAYFVKSVRVLLDTQPVEVLRQFPVDNRWRYRSPLEQLQPYAVLDQAGDVYVGSNSEPEARPGSGVRQGFAPSSRLWLTARAPAGGDVKGRLFLRSEDQKSVLSVTFRLPAADGNSTPPKDFFRIKQDHYESLLTRGIAGAAWFRHQAREAAKQLGTSSGPTNGTRPFFGRRWDNDIESTLSLVSGGRALSENLQLDRELPQGVATNATEAIGSIQGITVREFDWKPLLIGAEPQRDPLAAFVPDDQHAMFLPSFQSLTDLLDNAMAIGTPILRAAEPRAEDAQTRARYQKQLCLPLGEVERRFGPQLIGSLVITGGDPYFRTGTDVAVLFESNNVDVLRRLLLARMELAARDGPGAKSVSGETLGVKYDGFLSADRVICAYLASLDKAVVVTNSLQQLQRLVETHQGNRPALATLPEYKFFRQRYPRGGLESALLVISDKTIRRWCGPQWRIATSRRTRAAAAMSEIQAEHMERLVLGKIQQPEVLSHVWQREAGECRILPAGVVSATYGTLDFQTPIIELDVDKITPEEARLYGNWRDGYQRNWSNFFDPIAVRFEVAAGKLALDLTVMPLIDHSSYQTFVQLSQGAVLKSTDGDPHDNTLVHAVLALNRESAVFKQYANMAALLAPQVRISLLDWMGNFAAVYADDDPFWVDLAKAENLEAFGEKNLHRLPLALHLDVRNGLKLTAFLVGLRAYLDQSAPGMTIWETGEYRGQSYVKIMPSARAKSQESQLKDIAVFYAPSGSALVITLNEDVLKRSLDRQAARAAVNSDPQPANQPNPWLGGNLSASADRRVAQVLEAITHEDYQFLMQARAWGNIPILNEWKARFPDRDPVAIHAQCWGRRLVCPTGGGYRWNASWQTMESEVYGHPGEPRAGPRFPTAIANATSAKFGLTFEAHGLRSRVELMAERP